MRFLLLLFALPMLVQPTVRARFLASTGEPLVGEPVTMRLIVQAPPDYEIELPEFTETWDTFTITQVGEVRRQVEDGQLTVEQSLTIVPWVTGEYPTPETIIRFAAPGASEMVPALVQPAFFAVPSTLDADDAELTLRPAKPLVQLVYLPVILLSVAGAAAVVAIAGLYIVLRRFLTGVATRTRRSPQRVEQLSAAKRAMNDLRRLRASSDVEQSREIADTIRVYLAERMSIDTEDLTTQELIEAVELPEAQRVELRAMLEQGDLAKFAPGRLVSIEPLLDTAWQWVQTVEKLVRREERSA